MDRTALTELREKVRGLKGPDRETDALIGFKIGGVTRELLSPSEIKAHDEHEMGFLPDYTASVDAAIELIDEAMPGWSWEVRRSGFGTPAQATLWNPMKSPGPHNTWATRNDDGAPALALIDALLSALIASGPALQEKP